MNLAELLTELVAKSTTLFLRNGKLRYQPVASMTPRLLAGLAAHKADLLAELRGCAIERLFGPTAVLTGETAHEGPGTNCYACRGTTWWRLRGGSTWVCHACHRPIRAAEAIELVIASAAREEPQNARTTT